MGDSNDPKYVRAEDLQDLKNRMKLICDADPDQYHNDFSLKRYLRAFKTVDAAFQVGNSFQFFFILFLILRDFLIIFFQILRDFFIYFFSNIKGFSFYKYYIKKNYFGKH